MIDKIKSVIVDCVECEFYVDTKSDDMGAHYVVYIPCTEMHTDKLHRALQKLVLDKRYVIMLVPEGYIQYNFLG